MGRDLVLAHVYLYIRDLVPILLLLTLLQDFLKDKKKGDDAEVSAEEDDDLEAALKKEVQEMKDVKAKDRRFQVRVTIETYMLLSVINEHHQ